MKATTTITSTKTTTTTTTTHTSNKNDTSRYLLFWHVQNKTDENERVRERKE